MVEKISRKVIETSHSSAPSLASWKAANLIKRPVTIGGRQSIRDSSIRISNRSRSNIQKISSKQLKKPKPIRKLKSKPRKRRIDEFDIFGWGF